MVKQYLINLETGKSSKSSFSNFEGVKFYDDPVDRSQFRPDSEQVRQFRLSGAGSSGTPVYDDDSLPTDLEVDIRSGKLDKAEISQLQLAQEAKMKETSDKKLAAEEKKKADEINKARQDFLDKSTGFKGSDQTETV